MQHWTPASAAQTSQPGKVALDESVSATDVLQLSQSDAIYERLLRVFMPSGEPAIVRLFL